MSNAAALHEGSFDEGTTPLPNREEVLAQYFHLREISKRHHDAVMKFLSRDALAQQGRRLGLVHGGKFVLGSMDEMSLVVDLAIHTAPPDRSRAIDRYARSGKVARGSEEFSVLEAMRNARFSVLKVLRRHPTVGLIAADFSRNIDLWLVDVGLEASLPDGVSLATRYCTPGPFAMTSGIGIPVDSDTLERAMVAVPQLTRKSVAEALHDRRFAEAIYRDAIADGTMERTRFVDAFDDEDEEEKDRPDGDVQI